MEDYLNPPTYCPDALATDVGWINPKNGELLVSVRNLRQKIADRNAGISGVSVRREVTKSVTEQILDALTASTIASKPVDDRSTTQKILDKISDNLPPREVIKSTTEQILDKVTAVQDGNHLTLTLQDTTDVEDSFPKSDEETKPIKRGRGRPRKNT